jgi:hypothetical protein
LIKPHGLEKVEAGRLPIPPGPFVCINLNTSCVSTGVMTTTNHSQDQFRGIFSRHHCEGLDAGQARTLEKSSYFYSSPAQGEKLARWEPWEEGDFSDAKD